MYMSRASLRPEAVKNKSFWRLTRDFGNTYRIHRIVWSLFAEDPDKKRDFLYRQDEINGLPMFYFVSEDWPDGSTALWDMESKEYKPALYSGQRLVFSLRANPIVSKRDENGKQHRHDVVMDAKTRMEEEGISKSEIPQITEIVQKEGVKWLKRKGIDNGFEVDENQMIATGYRCNRFYKPKGKHSVNISTIDFSGILTVTEPDIFLKALYGGIGPAKSFGCGLLLVKPAQ